MTIFSVVVRTKNSAATLLGALDSIRSQSMASSVEVVVVDSGSTDATLDLASRWGARIVTLAPEDYTPGRSLNLGFDAARGEIVAALSSHCRFKTDRHLERALQLHSDSEVAATAGAEWDSMRRTIQGHLLVRSWPQGPNPIWGFSNHASTVRRSVWQALPFEESLWGCEDKEWAGRVHGAGYAIAYSPDLTVTADHRRSGGYRQIYRRTKNEGEAIGAVLPMQRSEALAVAYRQWRNVPPAVSPRSRIENLLRLARPVRAVETIGLLRGLSEKSNGESA